MADIANKANPPTLDAKKKAGATNALNLEKKRAMIDQKHRYLLDRFAEVIGEKSSELENSLLYGTKIELINEFFTANGLKKILFFWQFNKVGF
jgi:dynein heavy chain